MSALLGWLVSPRRRRVCWHRNSVVPDYVCKGVFWMVAKCCQCGGAAVQVQLPAARWKAPVLCSCPLLEIALHILLRCLCWGKRDVRNHSGCWARWLSIKQTTPPNFTVSEFWNVRVVVMPLSFLWTHPRRAQLCLLHLSSLEGEGKLEALGNHICF